MTRASQNTGPETAEILRGILQDALSEGDLVTVGNDLADRHPAEIADLIESLSPHQRLQVWQLISPERQGAVLSHAQDAVRAGLLEHMGADRVANVTRGLASDDAADILQDLPETMLDSVLRLMDEQNRVRVSSVLYYPEDTAGGLMNTDAITRGSGPTHLCGASIGITAPQWSMTLSHRGRFNPVTIVEISINK